MSLAEALLLYKNRPGQGVKLRPLRSGENRVNKSAERKEPNL